MARLTKAERLPEEIRQWLEQELIGRNFSDYREITSELNRRLEAAGEAGTLSREAVRRHGEKVGRTLEFEREVVRIAREQLGDGGSGEPALDHMRAVLDGLHVLTFRSMLDLRTQESVTSREVLGLQKAAEKTLRFEREIRSLQADRNCRRSPGAADTPLDTIRQKLDARDTLDREAEALRRRMDVPTAGEPVTAPPDSGDAAEPCPARSGTAGHETFRHETPPPEGLNRRQRRRLEREQARAAKKAARSAGRTAPELARAA